MKNIFIAPTVRSGGSLINRLFDSHANVAAYPFELFFPMSEALHPSLFNRGQKKNVQNFPAFSSNMTTEEVVAKLMITRDQDSCLVGCHFPSGKLKAKNTYLNLSASFNHSKFIDELIAAIGDKRSVGEIYNTLHKVFFENWDNGQHAGSMDYVVYHSGNGCMMNIDQYFKEFPDSYVLHPIRDIMGCLSSEKKKVAQQLIGKGFIGRKLNLSDKRLKRFYGEFFENIIVNWLIVYTRAVVNKKRFGDRYIMYRHEDLVRMPDTIMKALCEKTGLAYDPNLVNPTIAGVGWAGNSMFGKQSGINTKLAEVRDVFSDYEKEKIETYCGDLRRYLDQFEGKLIDFDNLDTSKLFDYDLQSKYDNDQERLSLYFASLYERWAYKPFMSRVKSSYKQHPIKYFLD